MTHELKELIETGVIWQKKGLKSVLATVVSLNGSSYRRPGVRMLLGEHNKWIGAVSGGCVEKEVYLQAQSVFETGKPKLMNYDGRFRLGCEGIIYILLEPLYISEECYEAFQKIVNNRFTFTCNSYFKIDDEIGIGSVLHLENKSFNITSSVDSSTISNSECFSQEFSPIFQLYIFGAEHDAVQLCKMATQIGWQVHIVAPPDEAKSLDYFEGAKSLLTPTYDNIDATELDKNTAVVLMTHSFNKDIQYLMALKDIEFAYFGLLGPSHRRERLFSKFLEYYPETDIKFFENINGPMGINIGAESASEISLSILAEILSVVRNQKPIFLKDKAGHIHA
ncbi:MAG: XdhC family protein [Polaribacter sp.]|nr:XdhC family protein [Polaribacter sp.]MDG1994318.1 XdhC family protein [Polaribacter sp.]